MSRHDVAFEHAEPLLIESLAADAVEMEDGGMGGETRPDARGGILLRPIQDLDERSPIRLVRQRRRTRLRPGHDEAIETAAAEVIDAAVAAAQMLPPSV